ncbi:Putative uncharacterized protein [Moritella viscosa]|uniref:Uncharacterized protein n=1 Tax=Moritella viscosa TaxID=80854 RepID=A0A1L0C705_9GAMM|nr:Putative uncharacterized protein [Moritella viscosa]SGZ10225.1 Putative uncharacterized protein [Moritella viscosa]SHO11700.1 Putative uncharacterized protein [Moritella viscosa]SHO11716.1 Putative uncharacterized protein [Moritella viscosa]SHO12982.1 Putative uncharacterized protein [Moritella viscosa]
MHALKPITLEHNNNLQPFILLSIFDIKFVPMMMSITPSTLSNPL